MSGFLVPQPPGIVSNYVDVSLQEVERILEAAAAAQSIGFFDESLGLLESAHETLLHVGKLADLQVAHHGMPSEADARHPLPVSSQDELMHSVAMMLTGYHFDNRWAQHMALTSDIIAGESYEKGEHAMAPALLDDAMRANSGSGEVHDPAFAVTLDLEEPSNWPAASHPYPSAYQTQQFPSGIGEGGNSSGGAWAGSGSGGTGVSYSSFPLSAPRSRHCGGGLSDDDIIGSPIDGSAARAVHTLAQLTSAVTPSADTSMVDGEVPMPLAMPEGAVKKARTKWSIDELDKFEEGVGLYGEHKPKLISQHMGTRNPEQVREHIKTLKRRQNRGEGGAS